MAPSPVERSKPGIRRARYRAAAVENVSPAARGIVEQLLAWHASKRSRFRVRMIDDSVHRCFYGGRWASCRVVCAVDCAFRCDADLTCRHRHIRVGSHVPQDFSGVAVMTDKREERVSEKAHVRAIELHDPSSDLELSERCLVWP